MSKYIDDILRNTRNAMEIMKRIRGFIRAKDVEFRPVNLHDVCTNVTSLMGDWLHSEGVDLQVSADGQPLNVQGDAVQLAQILVNLLRNATQATAGQARRQIRIILQSEGNQVTVRVQDNGPGFSAEVLENLKTFVADALQILVARGCGRRAAVARGLCRHRLGIGRRLWEC